MRGYFYCNKKGGVQIGKKQKRLIPAARGYGRGANRHTYRNKRSVQTACKKAGIVRDESRKEGSNQW